MNGELEFNPSGSLSGGGGGNGGGNGGGPVAKVKSGVIGLQGELLSFVATVNSATVPLRVQPVNVPLGRFFIAPRQGNVGVVYFARERDAVLNAARRKSFPVDAAPVQVQGSDTGGWIIGPGVNDALEFMIEIPGGRA